MRYHAGAWERCGVSLSLPRSGVVMQWRTLQRPVLSCGMVMLILAGWFGLGLASFLRRFCRLLLRRLGLFGVLGLV